MKAQGECVLLATSLPDPLWSMCVSSSITLRECRHELLCMCHAEELAHGGGGGGEGSCCSISCST